VPSGATTLTKINGKRNFSTVGGQSDQQGGEKRAHVDQMDLLKRLMVNPQIDKKTKEDAVAAFSESQRLIFAANAEKERIQAAKRAEDIRKYKEGLKTTEDAAKQLGQAFYSTPKVQKEINELNRLYTGEFTPTAAQEAVVVCSNLSALQSDFIANHNHNYNNNNGPTQYQTGNGGSLDPKFREFQDLWMRNNRPAASGFGYGSGISGFGNYQTPTASAASSASSSSSSSLAPAAPNMPSAPHRMTAEERIVVASGMDGPSIMNNRNGWLDSFLDSKSSLIKTRLCVDKNGPSMLSWRATSGGMTKKSDRNADS